MKIYILLVTISLNLLIPPKTRAEINMKDASYKLTLSDTKGIKRTYNSRSIHAGFFGFGWCSNIEVSIEFKSKNEIVLKHCDLESPFVLTDENNLLKTRMYEEFLTKEKIILNKNTYTHYLDSGEVRAFNKRGQLIQILTPFGENIEVIYEGNFPKIIKYKNNTSYFLHFNDTDQITKIAHKNSESIFLYEKLNLIQSLDENKKSHLYEYDSLNNLVQVTYPDQTLEKIAYNNIHDRVLKIELKNGCADYYDFQNPNQLYQVSTLIRKCSGKIDQKHIYEFWYNSRPDGLKFLERYKIQTNEKEKTQTIDISYHPVDGSVTKLLKNGISRI